MKLEKLTVKEEHISLSQNSIYFSSRLRKDKGFGEGDRFQFLYDKQSHLIVVIKIKEGGVRLNKDGYCKTRVNRLMTHGRYHLSDKKGDCLTFKSHEV